MSRLRGAAEPWAGQALGSTLLLCHLESLSHYPIDQPSCTLAPAEAQRGQGPVAVWLGELGGAQGDQGLSLEDGPEFGRETSPPTEARTSRPQAPHSLCPPSKCPREQWVRASPSAGQEGGSGAGPSCAPWWGIQMRLWHLPEAQQCSSRARAW